MARPPVGQARDDAHDEVNRGALPMEDRTVRFQQIAAAQRAVKLTPGAAAGMAIGTPVAQPQPAVIVTAFMGAKVQRGINHTGAPVGRGHGVGASWRLRLRVVGIVFTRGAMRSLRQTLEGFGFVGPFGLALRGHGFGRQLR